MAGKRSLLNVSQQSLTQSLTASGFVVVPDELNRSAVYVPPAPMVPDSNKNKSGMLDVELDALGFNEAAEEEQRKHAAEEKIRQEQHNKAIIEEANARAKQARQAEAERLKKLKKDAEQKEAMLHAANQPPQLRDYVKLLNAIKAVLYTPEAIQFFAKQQGVDLPETISDAGALVEKINFQSGKIKDMIEHLHCDNSPRNSKSIIQQIIRIAIESSDRVESTGFASQAVALVSAGLDVVKPFIVSDASKDLIEILAKINLDRATDIENTNAKLQEWQKKWLPSSPKSTPVVPQKTDESSELKQPLLAISMMIAADPARDGQPTIRDSQLTEDEKAARSAIPVSTATKPLEASGYSLLSSDDLTSADPNPQSQQPLTAAQAARKAAIIAGQNAIQLAAAAAGTVRGQAAAYVGGGSSHTADHKDLDLKGSGVLVDQHVPRDLNPRSQNIAAAPTNPAVDHIQQQITANMERIKTILNNLDYWESKAFGLGGVEYKNHTVPDGIARLAININRNRTLPQLKQVANQILYPTPSCCCSFFGNNKPKKNEKPIKPFSRYDETHEFYLIIAECDQGNQEQISNKLNAWAEKYFTKKNKKDLRRIAN